MAALDIQKIAFNRLLSQATMPVLELNIMNAPTHIVVASILLASIKTKVKERQAKPTENETHTFSFSGR